MAFYSTLLHPTPPYSTLLHPTPPYQMAFYILRVADPGSLSLAKSTAPYLVALMLRCSGQRINELQYAATVPPSPSP